MAQREEILTITVDYETAVNNISKFQDTVNRAKEDQKLFKEELKNGQITQKEYNRAFEESNAVIKTSNESIRSLRKEIENNIKIENSQLGSLRSLKAELSNATKAYNEMSRAEREGAKGQDMVKHIQAISNELKNEEENIGVFNRSIGSYQDALASAIGSGNAFAVGILRQAAAAGTATGVMTALKGAVMGVGTAMKALLANPIVLVLTAVIGVIATLTAAFKRNEEGMSKINAVVSKVGAVFGVLMDKLEPIASWLVDGLLWAFDKVADGIEKALNAIASAMEWLGLDTAAAGLRNFTKEAGDAARAAGNLNKATVEETRATEEATKIQKMYNDELAKTVERYKRQIQAARELEDQLTKDIADEKERQLEETRIAYDRQIEALKERIAAEEDQEGQAAKDLLSQAVLLAAEKDRKLTEINDKFDTERRAKDIQNRLETVEAGSREELKLRLEQLEIQQAAELKEAEAKGYEKSAIVAKYEKLSQDEITKTNAAIVKNQTDTVKKILDSAKDAGETKAQQAVADANAAIEAKQFEIDSVEQMVGESDEDFLNRKKELNDQLAELGFKRIEAEKQAEEEAKAARAEEIQTMIASVGEMFDALNGMLDEFGLKNEALAAMSKSVALYQLYQENAKAIASGLASAMTVGFPGNIAAAATTLATIAKTITSAKQIIAGAGSAPKWTGGSSSSRTSSRQKVQRFAEGGLVSGEGTSTSDSIPVMVSNGEYILNAASVRTLGAGYLDSLNSIGLGVPLQTSSAVSDTMGIIKELQDLKRTVAEKPSWVSVRDITLEQERIDVRDQERDLFE